MYVSTQFGLSSFLTMIHPVTNISRTWKKNPEALQRARRIVVMGGALDVPGNTSATAEFNFFADPCVPFSSSQIVANSSKVKQLRLS